MGSSIVPPEGEHLATGWEPDVPPDDTLVRQAVLVHASWAVEVPRALGRPARSTPRWAGGWIADRGDLTNWVVLLQPLNESGEVFDEVAEILPAHVPYVLVSPWPTPDLRTYGLALVGHPPLMVRFPGEGAAATARSSPGVEISEVRDAAGLAEAERVLVEGYPMPGLQPSTPGELLAPVILGPATRVWLGYVDGEPAAVAAAHVHGGVTLVEYVATLPMARGRGAGAAVTWAATLAEPNQPAVLIASDDGRPVYARMGYVALERWTVWLRPPR